MTDKTWEIQYIDNDSFNFLLKPMKNRIFIGNQWLHVNKVNNFWCFANLIEKLVNIIQKLILFYYAPKVLLTKSIVNVFNIPFKKVACTKCYNIHRRKEKPCACCKSREGWGETSASLVHENHKFLYKVNIYLSWIKHIKLSISAIFTLLTWQLSTFYKVSLYNLPKIYRQTFCPSIYW